MGQATSAAVNISLSSIERLREWVEIKVAGIGLSFGAFEIGDALGISEYFRLKQEIVRRGSVRIMIRALGVEL